VFAILARLKGVRGTALDVFGHTAERKRERALIGEYRNLVEEVLGGLTAKNLALAVDIASIPEHIRGYGHIKERHIAQAQTRQDELLAAWRAGKTRAPIAMAAE
jgi:indolepyruvate ferredoxin oxidoreductase